MSTQPIPTGIIVTKPWYQNSGARTVIPNTVEEKPWTGLLRDAVGLMVAAGIAGQEQRREFARELAAYGVIAMQSRKKGADFLGVDYAWLKDWWSDWLHHQRERRRNKKGVTQ